MQHSIFYAKPNHASLQLRAGENNEPILTLGNSSIKPKVSGLNSGNVCVLRGRFFTQIYYLDFDLLEGDRFYLGEANLL